MLHIGERSQTLIHIPVEFFSSSNNGSYGADLNIYFDL